MKGYRYYNHPEAFCLMRYATKDGMEVEWLWNSRDGLTPFIVHSRSGAEMQHTSFQYDRCLPNYAPLPGERIFVDMSEERAMLFAKRRVEQYWDHMEYPMSVMFATREEAEQEMYRSILRPGEPDIIYARDWKPPTQREAR